VIGGNVATPGRLRAPWSRQAPDAVKVGRRPGLDLHHAGSSPVVGAPQINRDPGGRHRRGATGGGGRSSADGGLQYSGDIAKALGRGLRSTTMLGLAAGRHRPSRPGDLIFVKRQTIQELPAAWGSLGAMAGQGRSGCPLASPIRRTATSRTTCFPRTSSCLRASRARVAVPAARLSTVIHQLTGGLRRPRWDTRGPATIEQAAGRRSLCRSRRAGLKESHPHDITMTVEAPNYYGPPLTSARAKIRARRGDDPCVTWSRSAWAAPPACTYELDDINIVPSRRTRSSQDVLDPPWQFGRLSVSRFR